MSRSQVSRSGPRLAVGLLVVAVGVLFTLDKLGLVEVGSLLSFWPLIFVAIGISKLASGGEDRTAGIVFTVLGVVALAFKLSDRLRVTDILDLWPLFLIAAGLLMVARSFLGGRRPERPELAGEDQSYVRLTAVLGSLKRRNRSPAFEGGDLTACLGACELDLSEAETVEAVIDIFAFWGGIEIRVPRSWSVDLRVTPFMGGSEDSTTPPPAGGPRLVIKGVAFMGGIGIKN